MEQGVKSSKWGDIHPQRSPKKDEIETLLNKMRKEKPRV
jgi:hypothetical protein